MSMICTPYLIIGAFERKVISGENKLVKGNQAFMREKEFGHLIDKKYLCAARSLVL